MIFSRIDLSMSYYDVCLDYKFISDVHNKIPQLNSIYTKYCKYKKFQSHMPIFDTEYLDPSHDIIGYYDNEKLIAFTIIRKHSTSDAEAIQFAWNYEKPSLSIGAKSLFTECALYKESGYDYLWLGENQPYKSKFDGYEEMGPL